MRHAVRPRRRRRLVAAAFIIAGVGMLTVPAVAQGATIEIVPNVVPAVTGDVMVTVTGTQFTMDGFVLFCAELDGDVGAAIDDPSGVCDLDALTPYSSVDGGWSVDIEVTITDDMIAAGSLVIVATDPAGADVAGAALMISDAVDAGEPLPVTGAGSALAALGGLNMIGFGGVLMISDRRRQEAPSSPAPA